MQILSTLSKHALVLGILGATGLPASVANAQFKVEYEKKAKEEVAKAYAAAAAPKASDDHVVVIKSHDDDARYEVKLVNGEVDFAEMNGNEVDHELVHIKGDFVVFVSEDGKKVAEFKLPQGFDWKSDKANFQWVTDAPKPTQVGTTMDVKVTPKVMLGINLTDPSDAVRKQLNLGDTKAIFVEKVIDGLPAKKAGLEDYDVIVSLDGSDGANGELLSKVLSKKSPGDPLKMVVLRGGEKIKLKAELSAYNAQKLSGAPVAVEIVEGHRLPGAWESKDGNSFSFAMGFGPELQERIHEALRSSGLDEEQLVMIEKQLHEHLGGLHNHFKGQANQFFFAPDAPEAHGHPHDEEHEIIIELEREAHEHAQQVERQHGELMRQREMVQLAQEKARAAMRDAERQVMELRNGRLFVHQADEMEDQMAQLEDRLSELEDRLEDQMDRMEEQVERMADMFERLLDRLEDLD